MSRFTKFSGYPLSIGSKRMSSVANGHPGPTIYAPITTAPLAGGDVIQAVEFGLQYLEQVFPAVSDDGLYLVIPVVSAAGPAKSVKLQWRALTSTTVAEAAGIDLSGSTVNLMAVGF